MRDAAYVSTVAGLAGGVVVNGLTYVQRMSGIRTMTPWGVAAKVFLRPDLAATAAGTILGLIVSMGMSVAAAFLVYLFLRLAGRDYALLKGVLIAESLGFGTLGLFPSLLGIAGELRSSPTTYFVALVNLAALGLTLGWLTARLMRGEKIRG